MTEGAPTRWDHKAAQPDRDARAADPGKPCRASSGNGYSMPGRLNARQRPSRQLQRELHLLRTTRLGVLMDLSSHRNPRKDQGESLGREGLRDDVLRSVRKKTGGRSAPPRSIPAAPAASCATPWDRTDSTGRGRLGGGVMSMMAWDGLFEKVGRALLDRVGRVRSGIFARRSRARADDPHFWASRHLADRAYAPARMCRPWHMETRRFIVTTQIMVRRRAST